jgi:hypothetical protein
VLRVGREFANRNDRTRGVAVAVVTNRSGEVAAPRTGSRVPTTSRSALVPSRTKTSLTSPWANWSDRGDELTLSNTRCIPRQYGSAISCFGRHSRVLGLTAEALSAIGQSKTWTAHKSFPVACAYAAAQR